MDNENSCCSSSVELWVNFKILLNVFSVNKIGKIARVSNCQSIQIIFVLGLLQQKEGKTPESQPLSSLFHWPKELLPRKEGNIYFLRKL